MSLLQVLLSFKTLFEINSKENINESRLIHMQCKKH